MKLRNQTTKIPRIVFSVWKANVVFFFFNLCPVYKLIFVFFSVEKSLLTGGEYGPKHQSQECLESLKILWKRGNIRPWRLTMDSPGWKGWKASSMYTCHNLQWQALLPRDSVRGRWKTRLRNVCKLSHLLLMSVAAASSEAWPLTQAQMVVVAEGPALRAG